MSEDPTNSIKVGLLKKQKTIPLVFAGSSFIQKFLRVPSEPFSNFIRQYVGATILMTRPNRKLHI